MHIQLREVLLSYNCCLLVACIKKRPFLPSDRRKPWPMNKQKETRLLHSTALHKPSRRSSGGGGGGDRKYLAENDYHTIPLGRSRGRRRYKVTLALLRHASSTVWHTPIVHGRDRYFSQLQYQGVYCSPRSCGEWNISDFTQEFLGVHLPGVRKVNSHNSAFGSFTKNNEIRWNFA